MPEYLSTGTSSLPGSPTETSDETDFLATARARYSFALSVDQQDRKEAEADNSFANASDDDLGQWAQEATGQRRAAMRPVLQWNRIPTYVQQVVNDGRQNKPAIRIVAADGGNKQTAEFFQARIRQIEYDSDADIAYDTARDHQVTSGRGFIRVTTEWIPGTFRQRLRIDRIENQFSVVFDPASKKYDRSDAEWCFVIEHISQDEHGRRYGKDKSGSQPFAQWENPAPGWFGVGATGKLTQVAEYWVKKYRKRRLVLLSTAEVPVWKDELTDEQYKTFKVNGNIMAERDEQHGTVCQYIINGAEIIEETDWIGSSIPIVPVWGREAIVEGRRRTFSLIRNAKDPQRLVNLYVSNIAEQIAQMPKTPYLVPVGGIAANHEEDWANASNSPRAYLYYQSYDANGKPLPAPTRENREPPIQALSVGLQQAVDAIKASMGIYDASIGARSNETSGIAIERRKSAAEVVNFHFPDNESRSRKRIGEILVECIPLVDKAGETATIRSEEGTTSTVPIGIPYQDPKTGQTVTHNLQDGDYGVSISTGPSFATARIEQRTVMAELAKTSPVFAEILPDRLVENLDYPGSERDAERVRRFISMQHPGVVQDENAEQPPIPPEVQQQMMAMKKELEQTQGFAQQLHEEKRTSQMKLEAEAQLKQMDIDAQMQLKNADLEFQREKLKVDSDVKLAVVGIQSDVVELKANVDRLNRERSIQSAERLAADSQAHEATQAERDRQHQADMAEIAASSAPAMEETTDV